MCGIAAVLNSEKTDVKGLPALMRDLLVVTQVRGMDSTGMYQMKSDRDLVSYKKAIDGSTFTQLPKATTMINHTGYAYATVAHCRKATTGGIKDLIAHPFMHETNDNVPDFGFVHNGTLDTWDKVEYSSDTEYLANKIFVEGTKGFDALPGSWACIWTDLTEDNTYVARNDQRTLFYALLKDKNVMIIASEVGTISWLADRNDLVLEDDAIYAFEEYQAYCIPVDDVRAFTKEAILKPVLKNAATYKHGYNYHGNSNGSYKTARETMLDNMRALVNEIKGTVPVTTVNTETLELPKTLEATEQEQLELLYFGVDSPIVIKAVASMYDPTTAELYLECASMPESRVILQGDTIVMRNMTPTYAKYLQGYDELTLFVTGYNDGVSLATSYFIAEKPTPSCLKASKRG